MREVPGLWAGSWKSLCFHRISGWKNEVYLDVCATSLLHPVGGQSMKNSLLIAGTLRPFLADQLCMDSWERCPCKNVFRMSCRKSKAIWMCCSSLHLRWIQMAFKYHINEFARFVAQECPQHLRLKNASNKTPRVLNGNLNCSRRPHIRLHSPHVSLPTTGFAKTWQILERCSSYLNVTQSMLYTFIVCYLPPICIHHPSDPNGDASDSPRTRAAPALAWK